MNDATTECALFTELDQAIAHAPGPHQAGNVLVRFAFMRYGVSQGGALTGEGAADVVDETDIRLKGSTFDGVYSSKEIYAAETARLAMLRIRNPIYDPVKLDAYGWKYAFDEEGVNLDEVKAKIRFQVNADREDHALKSIGMWRRHAPRIENRFVDHIKPQTEAIARTVGLEGLRGNKESANIFAVIHSPGADLVYAPRSEAHALITPRLGHGKTFAIAFTVTPLGDVNQLPVLVGLEPDEIFARELFE